MPLTPTPLPIGARGSIVPSPLWGEGQGEGHFPSHLLVVFVAQRHNQHINVHGVNQLAG